MPVYRQSPPTKAYPANADFALTVVVDRGTGYLADGEDTLYYTSVTIPDADMWLEIAQDIAGDDPLLSFHARAVWQGRFGDHDDTDTDVSWSASGAHYA